MDDTSVTRRDALKIGAFGAAALALPLTATLTGKRASDLPDRQMPRPYVAEFAIPPVARRSTTVTDAAGRPVYVMQMEPFQAQIAAGNGPRTTMWGYRDMSNPGVPYATFPGPTIVAQRLQPIVVRQINNLPARHPVFGYVPTTSTHLHGHPSLPHYDGYANDLTAPGQFKDYVYENNEDARTIWYHDHPAHHTAENVYWGLAAQYQLNNAVDNGRYPTGAYDVPLILNDIALDRRGQLLFDDRGDSGPMGDIILANGRPWPLMRVERRRYRFRLLNAAIARSFRLRLSTGGPMTIISTDGGLLPVPARTNELLIGMAERYEAVIDFSQYRVGQRVELRNLDVDNTIEYDHTNKVMAFQVIEATSPETTAEPQPLPPEEIPAVMRLTEAEATQRRRLEFERSGSEWTINDKTWTEVERSGFQDTVADPALGAVELWTLENGSGGWFHPIHLHLVDFQVLSRSGRAIQPYERGPKDVVYLGENETVRVLARFGPHAGRYMIHCHNNSHEDHDMMHQMQVGEGGFDPVTTAPPQPLPAPDTTVVPAGAAPAPVGSPQT
jgi:spore coat protein A, manganese oxidase